MSWFCNQICSTDSENQHQIVFMNNLTQQTFNLTKGENYNARTQQLTKLQRGGYQNNNQGRNNQNIQNSNIEMRSLSRNFENNYLKSGFVLLKKSLYQKHQQKCQINKSKFTDEEFKPSDKSLGLFQSPELAAQFKSRPIVWRRLSELYPGYQLFRDSINPGDIQQGNIGDCYFLSAISALAQNQLNILQIFQCQSIKQISKSQYGLYKVVINKGGQPEEVVVDDYIPVFDKSLRPVFCKPFNNEFWVVILQKAWAKINGSYAKISQGNPHEVLNKFSVAPVCYHSIPQHYYRQGYRKQRISQVEQFQQNLWNCLKEAHTSNYPMCCGSRNVTSDDGIKQNHSYTLLGVYEVIASGMKSNRIVKIRNPWGDTEYKGEMSQSDTGFWKNVRESYRKEVFDKVQNDGVFTMPFERFLDNFQSIDICHSKLSYNYIYKQLTLNPSNPIKFLHLSVQTQGEVYLTFEKNYNKSLSSSHMKYVENGITKMLIAQDVGNERFEFIDCTLETVLADTTIRCSRLKAGNYIIMIQNQQIRRGEKSFSGVNGTISTYSNILCTLVEIPEPKNFLNDFFGTHAIKYNKQKKQVGPNDWIARKLLSNCGYGYITINLSESSQKTFEISINKRLITQAGFDLIIPKELTYNMIKNPRGDQQIQIILHPGEFATFLFKVQFKKQGELKLSFPPEGFDIKKII